MQKIVDRLIAIVNAALARGLDDTTLLGAVDQELSRQLRRQRRMRSSRSGAAPTADDPRKSPVHDGGKRIRRD
jgi:hypothetical protein